MNMRDAYLLSFSVLSFLLCAGCGAGPMQHIDDAIEDYNWLAPHIHIDDSKEKVLAILGPTQTRLAPEERMPSRSFQRDGKLVEILFFRTKRIPDDLTTDDEFTPYIFIDGKLHAIGWTALGVPITRVSERNASLGTPRTTYPEGGYGSNDWHPTTPAVQSQQWKIGT